MKTAFLDITDKEYHGDKTAVGSSTLKSMLENPIKGYKEHINEKEVKRTEALIMGGLIHTLVLEPNEFNDRYIVNDEYKEPKEELIVELEGLEVLQYPQDVLTPSGKLSTAKAKVALIEELQADDNKKYLTPEEYANYIIFKVCQETDKIVISNKMYELAQSVADKARSYEFQYTPTKGAEPFYFTLKDLEANNIVKYEKAFYAYINPETLETSLEEKEGYIKAKCKPDIMVELDEDVYLIYDLKTAVTADPKELSVAGAKRYYPVQEALYTLILEANGLQIPNFRFFIVGKEDWATAQDYEYDQPSKDLGKDLLKKALKLFNKAKKGEVKETLFDATTGEYDREPIVTVPTYMFYNL